MKLGTLADPASLSKLKSDIIGTQAVLSIAYWGIAANDYWGCDSIPFKLVTHWLMFTAAMAVIPVVGWATRNIRRANKRAS